jgi:hypothetical protein
MSARDSSNGDDEGGVPRRPKIIKQADRVQKSDEELKKIYDERVRTLLMNVRRALLTITDSIEDFLDFPNEKRRRPKNK